MIKILVVGAFAEITKDVESLRNNRMYDSKQELTYQAGLHLLESGYYPDIILLECNEETFMTILLIKEKAKLVYPKNHRQAL